MTARERLRASLHGERWKGRASWSPLFDGYFLSSRPAGTDALAAFRDVGADALVRHVFTWSTPIRHPRGDRFGRELVRRGAFRYTANGVDVAAQTNKTDAGTEMRISYTVNGRELWERYMYTATSPYIPFPLDHLIKDLDDLEAYMEILRRDTCEPQFDAFVAEDARIGDEGFATDTAPTSPIQEMIQHLMGIEAFYTRFLADHPAEVDELSALMHRKNLEVYEVLARSPAEVVIDYENTSTTLISPQLYERYSAGCIDDYADVVHRGGKVFLTHRCGKLQDLLPQIARGRDDGIADLSPAPTGNVTMWDGARLLPGKILVGGLDATVLAAAATRDTRRATEEIVERCRDFGGIIIGSGDAVPQNARMENLREVTKVVDEREAARA